MAAVLTLGGGLIGSAPPASAGARTGTADTVPIPSTTIPGKRLATPRSTGMVTADDSGYLSSTVPLGHDGSATWVRDGGGTVAELPSPVAVNGGLGLERTGGGTGYLIRRYATGETVRFDVPSTDTVTGIFAANRLVTLRKTDNSMHLLEIPAGGGALVDRPVTGLPADMSPAVYTPASDDRGAAFWWKPTGGGAPWRTGLLDFETAHVTAVPSDDFGLLEYPRLSGGKVAFMALDQKFQTSGVYVVDRAHPERPGTLVDSLDGVADARTEFAVVGDWLVYVRPGSAQGEVRAVPLAGGAARTLLPRSHGAFVRAADGSLLVEGGTDAEHWGIRHVTPGADGAPAADLRTALPPVSAWEAGGFAVDQGRVLLAAQDTATDPDVPHTMLHGSAVTRSADGTVSAQPPQELEDLGSWVPGDGSGDPGSSGYYSPCSGSCLRLTGTGESSVAHEGYGTPYVVAASGSYRVVRASATDQQVRDGEKVLRRGAEQAAALWGGTLWTPGSTRGTVQAVSLPSMTPAGTETVGADCTPRELQVVSHWIYWSCGPGGHAGVYDRTTKRRIDVPEGYAQLADGYLVSQDDSAHRLRITYLPGAVPVEQEGTHDLAPLPSPVHAPADRRGRFWAVDRFGGPLAYLDASGDAVVMWPKVRTAALSVIDKAVPSQLTGTSGWRASWHLSKPAEQWKLTLAQASDGTVRRTFGGTTARGRIAVDWDGTTNGTTRVPAGTYRWTLTAHPADHTGPLLATGLVTVR
ncbi:hypothetical protein ACZ90_25810 [Streptomyces albus subsp. albus]|nr:hypothetical protein ACZ90_25810 [Streptomyces albus subsp. albus]